MNYQVLRSNIICRTYDSFDFWKGPHVAQTGGYKVRVTYCTHSKVHVRSFFTIACLWARDWVRLVVFLVLFSFLDYWRFLAHARVISRTSRYVQCLVKREHVGSWKISYRVLLIVVISP